MNVFVNEKKTAVPDGSSVAELVSRYKPDADIFVKNGFLTTPGESMKEGDRLVLIRRGEVPAPEDLEALISARHTPGIMSKLKKATIGIAGCGGLGSTSAISLARIGIGRLIIVDFDVVEPSNLNRQQFFIDQIGRPKVEALRETIARINPAISVVAHAVKLDATNIPTIFRSVDVLVEAFDRADQKAMLVETVSRTLPGLPLILGLGMAGWGGNDILKTRHLENWHICGDSNTEAAASVGLMAPRVGIVANMQANQVMEVLLGPDPQLKNDVGMPEET
ncbi:MAG: sulfur carrier protein ThiS adenylyltransferase ThiF [Candidatus Riflebacteria bacterium]|nr:sulfur carrier protein ThiS adenylyltransferase ThiF [Candidatus Riflebacteria bacterium]